MRNATNELLKRQTNGCAQTSGHQQRQQISTAVAVESQVVRECDPVDFRNRTDPEIVNRLLYESVPVLSFTKWRIARVGWGYCETVLPLNESTTNQHGTHQAALISLSADYTGGMALTTILEGVPIAGIHPAADNSASLWLASMDVKYSKPSTGHLTGVCIVPDEVGDKLRKRYRQGKRILVTLEVRFESNGDEVATAKMKYFAQPTAALMDCSRSISPLFSAKVKASARMIAGVRAGGVSVASESPQTIERRDDPADHTAAGPHGMLLANRLKRALPQLPPMVLARTRHIDELLASMTGLDQIVFLGAGLDMRLFRYLDSNTDHAAVRFFEIDLPEMLVERERVIAQLDRAGRIEPQRVSIPANFLEDDVEKLLRYCDEFSSELKTAFIYEGCSMYFDALVNASLITSVARLMEHPESRLWADFVSADVAAQTVDHPDIQAFLHSMTELGESFTYGLDDPVDLLCACGMVSVKTVTAQDCVDADNASSEVLTRYRFTISGSDAGQQKNARE